ncbi:MAG: DUF3786 domain-containing protein [Syntrophobacteraceae bacterium]|jgi:hypothetical protein|nr:DUF3786 domain-containing protein [Syntrophobacteraceae bacterium]
MKDEHREMLDKRLTPMHLYRLTPRTNCRECGFETCLAFATQVIVGQGDLDLCPYLDQEAVRPLREQLRQQHAAGIGVKKEGFEKALHFLRGEIRKWDFREVARSLGADYSEPEGGPTLRFAYFNAVVNVTHEDIGTDSGEALGPYDKILLYNYVIGGAADPAGIWVGMETLPNSVSKIKSLRGHCEDPLAQKYAGRLSRLPEAVAGIGTPIELREERVDFAVEFPILPRLGIRVLWWDEDPAEGFAARVKFLFDQKVLETLDLESLLFTCEQLTDRLLAAAR